MQLIYWHRFAIHAALHRLLRLHWNQYHMAVTLGVVRRSLNEELRLSQFNALVQECQRGLSEFAPDGYRPTFTIREN